MNRHARSLVLAGTLSAAAIAVPIMFVVFGHSQRRRPVSPGPSAGTTAVACRHVASPRGRDTSRGTLRRPFRTLRRLEAALRPGETGCLRGGIYTENADFFRGGLPGRPITIRSYPGERARLDGALWITTRAHYVTVRDMTLCGAPGPGRCSGRRFSSGEASAVQVSGGHATFYHDDVSNSAGICFILGTAQRASGRAGPGDHVAIEQSLIHNCGVPGKSNLIEGIYDQYSTGAVIAHNDIYDNAAMGIQFYPAAQQAMFAYNVVWGNGEGVLFGGSENQSSNGNLVEHNVIGHSVTRWNIESNWPGPIGTGNVAADNCVYANNPLAGGYYNQAGGVELAAAGAAGFTSLGAILGPKCALSALHGLPRP